MEPAIDGSLKFCADIKSVIPIFTRKEKLKELEYDFLLIYNVRSSKSSSIHPPKLFQAMVQEDAPA